MNKKLIVVPCQKNGNSKTESLLALYVEMQKNRDNYCEENANWVILKELDCYVAVDNVEDVEDKTAQIKDFINMSNVNIAIISAKTMQAALKILNGCQDICEPWRGKGRISQQETQLENRIIDIIKYWDFESRPVFIVEPSSSHPGKFAVSRKIPKNLELGDYEYKELEFYETKEEAIKRKKKIEQDYFLDSINIRR